jgi:hypothetical protein
MNTARRAVIGLLGGATAMAAMSASARADALERAMLSQLDGATSRGQTVPPPTVPSGTVRAGLGRLFGSGREALEPLKRMSTKPTLVDFFSNRFGPD